MFAKQFKFIFCLNCVLLFISDTISVHTDRTQTVQAISDGFETNLKMKTHFGFGWFLNPGLLSLRSVCLLASGFSLRRIQPEKVETCRISRTRIRPSCTPTYMHWYTVLVHAPIRVRWCVQSVLYELFLALSDCYIWFSSAKAIFDLDVKKIFIMSFGCK